MYSYIATQIEKNEKMKEKVAMGLKRSFSSHWLIVRLNLSSDNGRNHKETTTFLKKMWKVIECKKKKLSNWRINKDLYLKNRKKLAGLKKCIKNGTSKTHESVRKLSKTQSGNEFAKF